MTFLREQVEGKNNINGLLLFFLSMTFIHCPELLWNQDGLQYVMFLSSP